MDGLNSLRRRTFTDIPDPMAGPIFPNEPPALPGTENVSQPNNTPDNTINTLAKIFSAAQAMKAQGGQSGTGETALLNATSPSPGVDLPSGYRTPSATPSVIPISNALLNPIWPRATLNFPDTETPAPPINQFGSRGELQVPGAESTPAPPINNALLRNTAPTTEPVTTKPANSLLDYWAKPVVGKMPLDQFVQLAGMAANALAPREWSGRLGAGLAQMGGQAYAERVRREEQDLERLRREPENILRRRLLEAQIGEAETPKPWGAFYKEHINTVNPDTGKTYTVGETLKAFHEAQTTVTPKEPTYHYTVDNEGNVSTFANGKLISGSGKGESKTEPKEGEHYEVDDQGRVSFYKGGQLISGPGKGKTKTPSPGPGEKLTMTDVKSAYSMDIGNIKNQMMIDMTPDEQANISGQPTENILALLLSGRVGKSLSPDKKKLYIDKLQEIERTYGDLTNQVLGRKGAKITPKGPGIVASEVPLEVPPSQRQIPGIKTTPTKKETKGKSVQDVIGAGGKAVKMPDGSTHVFDKDGNYVGTVIK